MDIAGKVALVTGGASGIGKAMVEIILQKQAKAVFIVDINEEAMEQTQAELEKEFGAGKIHVCKCDVASKEQLEECFKQVIATYGALHIVCNNAGMVNEVEWETMLQVNLNGVITGTKLAVQYMEGESCGGGVIINTSSEGVKSLAPLLPVYLTSKYAIFGFTQQIATFDPIVVKKKIRVNTLCPPGIKTNIHPTLILENEIYQGIIQPLIDAISKHGYTTQELAQHFVKLIEEPYHAAAMYTPKEKYEIFPDETKSFRERRGLEETYMKLRDAAVEQL